MFISVLKLTLNVAARFEYESDFRPLYRSLPDKGDRGQRSISHQRGSSRSSPSNAMLPRPAHPPSLPPSLLRISREPFSSSVSLSQSTDYTVTEFVSETVSAFIRIPCFDLLVDEVLFVMTCVSRPPLIRPSRYNNVHRFQRILKRLKVYRGLEDILPRMAEYRRSRFSRNGKIKMFSIPSLALIIILVKKKSLTFLYLFE